MNDALTTSSQAPTASTLFLASHCAMCGRGLTDETSISWGIGPDCRRNYGFDKQDAKADWGRALGALGPDFPVHIYEGVVNAWSEKRGHEFTADQWIDTSKQDVHAAICTLVHALATAPAEKFNKEQVARILLCLSYLGHKRLAAAFVRSFMRRKDYRSHYPLAVVIVDTVKNADGSTHYVVRNSYDSRIIEAIRSIPYENRRFEKFPEGATRTYGVRRDPRWIVTGLTGEQLFAIIMAACPDLVAGEKGIKQGRKFPESVEPQKVCWTDPLTEDEKRQPMCWVDRETNNFIRFAIELEPTHRPGLEKCVASHFL